MIQLSYGLHLHILKPSPDNGIIFAFNKNVYIDFEIVQDYEGKVLYLSRYLPFVALHFQRCKFPSGIISLQYEEFLYHFLQRKPADDEFFFFSSENGFILPSSLCLGCFSTVHLLLFFSVLRELLLHFVYFVIVISRKGSHCSGVKLEQ